MEYRHLGQSGLKVSELTYGNWITHGSQVEEDAARSFVAVALDEGITSFDTAKQGTLTLDDALGGSEREGPGAQYSRMLSVTRQVSYWI